MTVERFNRKLDANTARMLRNEDRGALKMYKILEDSRMELIAKLSRHTERGNGYSMTYYQAMLADVEAVMSEMYARATAMMKDEMTSAFTLGQNHLGAEVAIFETGGLAVITPKVSTAVLDIIINERTEFIGRLTESVKRTMIDEVRREAATRAANQAAASTAAATEVIQEQLLQGQVTGIKNALAKGFVQGDAVPQIVRRLTHPTDGTFIRMARPSAIRTVRIGMNDTYNEGRSEQLRSVHERLPHIKRAWRSALQDSTPICLHLHGQKCGVGEPFKYGGWQGDRPPAIGGGAEPKFHLCRSVVVATSERWPVNPLLEPLSAERIAHFNGGGRFQGRDIVRPSQGPRPKPGTKPAPRPMPVQPKPPKPEAKPNVFNIGNGDPKKFIPGSAHAAFEEIFGKKATIDGLTNYLTPDLPGYSLDGFTILPDYDRKKFYLSGAVVNADGRKVADITRTISKDSVHHDYFFINDNAQGSGIAISVYKKQFQAYKEMGIKNVDLLANGTVGRYAWSLQGFDFKKPEDLEKRKGTLKRLMEQNGLLTKDNEKAVEQLKHSWEISAFTVNGSDDKPLTFQPKKSMIADGIKDAPMSIGKYTMLTSPDWEGEVTLTAGHPSINQYERYNNAKK
jgi:hypothetical protein